jgi:hypothetical protein
MVPVQVGNQDMGNLTHAHTRFEQLSLGIFCAVNEYIGGICP